MLKRRTFLAYCTGLSTGFFAQNRAWGHTSTKSEGPSLPCQDFKRQLKEKSAHNAGRQADYTISENISGNQVSSARAQAQDWVLDKEQIEILKAIVSRFSRLQDYVGHGNFNIIGWDQSLQVAKTQPLIDAFTRPELEFVEELFFTHSSSFGFYGEKVSANLSSSVEKKDIVKIPGSGHYLFKGDAFNTYQNIRRDVGDSIILTSGIRNIVKQLYLFLDKADREDGNLSLTAFSLAPPGYSYHAVGDFDVGKKGFGKKNFTKKFTRTNEFKRLLDLDYLDFRYPLNNPYGVRYEPWHIKVV